MQIIEFPGMHISLRLSKQAFKIFGIPIYWYAILIVFAILIAIIFTKIDDGKYGIKFDNIVEVLICTIPVSILCARIYYVVFNSQNEFNNISQLINIRNGGLAIYGGIIGAVTTIAIYCKIKKIKLADMLDYLVPYLALGQAIGRWGNFINVEAYGTETDSLLRMKIFQNGEFLEVHPTFLYESFFTFLIFIILMKIRKNRKYSGQLVNIYFISYGLIRFIIEGIRSDSLMFFSFRVSQIFSILLIVIGGINSIYSYYKTKINNKHYNLT